MSPPSPENPRYARGTSNYVSVYLYSMFEGRREEEGVR